GDSGRALEGASRPRPRTERLPVDPPRRYSSLNVLQPEPHIHLAIHRPRGVEVLTSRAATADTPIESAETEVTMGDEWTHAVSFGERQRLAVVSFGPLGVESVGTGRDIAQQVQRMGREAGMARREVDRESCQAPRLVDAAEQQSGPAQRVVGPGEMRHDSRRRETLDDLLAQLELIQRFARFTELRRRPGGGGERARQLDGDVAAPE